MRYWTCHWQNRYWTADSNDEGEPLTASGSNMFRKRGVAPGDSIYVLSLRGGVLLLGGRMTVGDIVSRDEAVRRTGNDNLYDASEWVLAAKGSGTKLDLFREISPEVARDLRFVSATGKPKGLFFETPTQLDVQATRGVRELTRESAHLLDRILKITDSMPRSLATRQVTRLMLSIG